MNCRQFNEVIVDLACGLPMEAAERSRALEHAEVCPQCSILLARQQSMAAGLQALAVEEREINAPAVLGCTLQAEFERQMNRTGSTQPVVIEASTNWRQGWMNWRLAAVAATLMAFLAGASALYLKTRHQLSVPAPEEKIASVQNDGDQEKPALIMVDHQGAKLSNSVRQRKRRQLKTTSREVAEYGAFLSLVPMAQTEPEEYQQVVRMQIPRALLRLWKLPVNEESTNEQVSADVFFSEDGVARAIRLRN